MSVSDAARAYDVGIMALSAEMRLFEAEVTRRRRDNSARRLAPAQITVSQITAQNHEVTRV